MTITDPLFDESDTLDDRNYCKHGTFIGNPYGADYMCGWCEDGVSVDEYRAAMRYQAAARLRARPLLHVALAFLCFAYAGDEPAFLQAVKPTLDQLAALDDDTTFTVWDACKATRW